MNDSIWMTSDSNALHQSELVKQGILLPDHQVPMKECSYTMRGDDYVVIGIAVLFFIIALVLYRSRTALLFQTKNFFTTQRMFVEENVENSLTKVLDEFLLTCISALSLSCFFLHHQLERSCLISTTGVPYWLFAAGLVVFLAFIYLKAGLYALVNWTFFDTDSNQRWMRGYLLMTALTAFLFYPLLLLDVFAYLRHEFVIGGAILVVIMYELLLFYKLKLNFRARKYGYMLIFLYFCTVELIPTLVLGHLAVWFCDNYLDNNILY